MNLVEDLTGKQAQKGTIRTKYLCWLCSLHKIVIEGPEVNIVEKIKKARSKNKEMIRVVKEIKKAGVKALRGKKWQTKKDLVLKEGKVYVLKDEKLRVEIIQLHHDVPVAEHEGKQKTIELVTRNYWWRSNQRHWKICGEM